MIDSGIDSMMDLKMDSSLNEDHMMDGCELCEMIRDGVLAGRVRELVERLAGRGQVRGKAPGKGQERGGGTGASGRAGREATSLPAHTSEPS